MEINLTEQGTFEILWDKMDILISLLALGFSIALVVVVIAAGARLGWRFWPWVLAIGLIAWLCL